MINLTLEQKERVDHLAGAQEKRVEMKELWMVVVHETDLPLKNMVFYYNNHHEAERQAMSHYAGSGGYDRVVVAKVKGVYPPR